MDARPDPAPPTPDETPDVAPDVAPVRHDPSRRRLGVAIAVGVVVLDQVVKYGVEQVLEPGRFVPWLSDDIGWQLVYNDGAAFGLPLPWWLFLLVASVVVVVVWRTLPQVRRTTTVIAYGMMVAGAVGNVIDRLVRTGDPGDPRFFQGHVVDFVAWGTFARFNVADAAITLGFALLAWELWRHGEDGVVPDARPAEKVRATTAADRPLAEGDDATPTPRG